jgi:amino acid permease
MYGAMCLKYASGSESFVQAVSFTIYKDANYWTKISPVDPYYLGIVIFGSLSLFFSFGNIENSKTLQIVTGAMRFIVIIFMYGGTIYYLITSGVHTSPVFDLSEQFKHIANTFGGTVFVFIFHHSISGIVYPIRP